MTPGWATASWSASLISRMRFMRVMTTVSAPSTAMAPPDSPVPAPRGTTGVRCSDASRRIAATSAVEEGNATPSGRPGCMYSVSSQR